MKKIILIVFIVIAVVACTIFGYFYYNSKHERNNDPSEVLSNYYEALKEFFGEEKWCNENSILCKTSGYDAFMRLFLDFYNFAEKDIEKLKQVNFYKEILEKSYNNIDIDIDANKLGAAGAAHLYSMLKEKFPIK